MTVMLPRPKARSAHPRASVVPGVSVIIPSYEGWPTLRMTVLAVLHDARGLGIPWEVIVVDNESNPGLVDRISALAEPRDPLRVIRRTGLRGRHYQPGAARNVGIDHAKFDWLVFLDADCVPAPTALARYRDRLAADPSKAYIGHRVFVDVLGLDALEVAHDRQAIDVAPRVRSVSNYGEIEDRRLPELLSLAHHPRPYDCLFSCNFALHKVCLGRLRFNSMYDGYWGYEDIDLGFRLHQAGRRFEYVPDAFAFHQEASQVPPSARATGRARNMPILDARCPGFIDFRAAGGRVGSSGPALARLRGANRFASPREPAAPVRPALHRNSVVLA
jgi:glycosyltransferase involved in cell wall biosynthesis